MGGGWGENGLVLRGMVSNWKREVKRYTRKERGLYKINFHELIADWSKIVKEKKIPQTGLAVD